MTPKAREATGRFYGPMVTEGRAASGGSPKAQARSLEDVERQHIVTVLEETGWRVSGAARRGEDPGPQANDARGPHEEARDFPPHLIEGAR